MTRLNDPARQVLRSVVCRIGTLKFERATICSLCDDPCPAPPEPDCPKVSALTSRISNLTSCLADTAGTR